MLVDAFAISLTLGLFSLVSGNNKSKKLTKSMVASAESGEDDEDDEVRAFFVFENSTFKFLFSLFIYYMMHNVVVVFGTLFTFH